MRCRDESCSDAFYRSPARPDPTKDLFSELPRCKHCNEIMKPHCMFFDEQYSEKWYKSTSVKKYLEEKLDGLIVVGTAL